jgi:hypothetical protein
MSAWKGEPPTCSRWIERQGVGKLIWAVVSDAATEEVNR